MRNCNRFSKVGVTCGILFTLLAAPNLYAFDMDIVKPGPKEALDIDQFIVIVDASASMETMNKFEDELEALEALTQGMPRGDYEAGLDSFGDKRADWERNPLDDFNRRAMQSAASRVVYLGGKTPLQDALAEQVPELQGKEGRGAILLFSDGQAKRDPVIEAVQELDQAHGELLCIYTLQFGSSKRGARLLEEVSQVTGCGQSWSADDADSVEGMTDLIRTIFFAPDSDGDGVVDRLDECPGTPRGTEVDDVGCPLDTDGDGVYDHLDKCPGTLKGAPVDDDGCWKIDNVNFDTDKHEVKAKYDDLLAEVARVLKMNPRAKLSVSGHTDSDASDDYNKALAERRTNQVIKHLKELGVSGNALVGDSSGESNPVSPNDTEQNKYQNRRVELSVIR